MWHVETDYFALAIFLIMLIKESPERARKRDRQGNAFFLVLLFSIFNVTIDIISSLAMNQSTEWWMYEYAMTLYVASMPLLAAVWVCYAYVLIHRDGTHREITRGIVGIVFPYLVFVAIAISNPYTEWFFHLTDDMQYSRGALFMPVGVGFIMFYSAAGLLQVLFHWKKITPRSNAVLLVLFFLTTACFIWIQLANPGWLVINASYALVYVWCDFTVEEQRRSELYGEINRKNEELKVIAEKAESATQAKSEFLSRMSHDIRTPMNAIIGLTHLAEEEDDAQKVKTYLHSIETSSSFLLGLINDILDMSKIENGELMLKDEVYHVDEFIESINTIIKPLMDEKNIDFQMNVRTSTPCIRTDKLRFNQIFFNLLSNAAKFTPEGGRVEFLAADLPERDGKAGLRFTVRDSGVGMSKEFLQQLYDPFSQERSAEGDKQMGTGLGLPIVKSLVDIMGGTIAVQSELGEGTTFTVELYVDRAELPAPQRAGGETVDDLRGVRILLVEDNEINIYVAELMLEKLGCETVVARNGQEAVERFEASKTDEFGAILMDVRMPVMDGIEATKRIRALRRADAQTVPIIAMTADAFAEERKRTLESGMNYHLSKPIEAKLLEHVLCEHVKRGAAE